MKHSRPLMDYEIIPWEEINHSIVIRDLVKNIRPLSTVWVVS